MILLVFSFIAIDHYRKPCPLKKIVRRIGKILAWMTGSIIFLLVLIVLLIQIPAVQDFLRGRVVSYLQNKLGTKVAIRRIDLDLPKKLVLEGVYFEDQKKDTLLAGERLAVDISLFKLLRNEVEVNYLELEGIRANIYRIQPDTVFNFDYIVKAFTGPPKEPELQDTSAAPMRFDIGKIHLKNIRVTFRDDGSGNDVYCYLGELDTRVRTFDPDKMIFSIPKIRISGIDARFRQYKPFIEPKPEAVRQAEAAEPVAVSLDLGTLDLQGIRFDYRNDISALSTQLDLGQLQAEADSIDLAHLYVHLKNLELANTTAALALGATQQAKVVEEETEEVAAAQVANPWHFLFDKVRFRNNHLKFDNNNSPRQARGMDYAHLDVRDLAIDAEKLSFTPAVFEGDVKHLSVNEQSGLQLKELRANFRYDERQAYLHDLYLETDKTLLRDRMVIQYPSIERISQDVGLLYIDAGLKDTRIATRDILLFAPQLATVAPFSTAPDAVYRLSAVVRGPVRDLGIAQLEFAGLDRTNLQLSGRIKGLPDAERTYYDLRLARLSTSERDLQKLLPAGSLPPDMRIPETIDLQGVFTGRMQEFTTHLDARTSRGNLIADAYLKNYGASYSARVKAAALDAGYLLKQEQNLGQVTLQAQAKGSGFDPKTAVSDFRMQVFSAGVKGYTYRNLSLQGKAHKGTADIAATMNDPNLRFNLDATALFNNTYPAVRADLMLDSADFAALKLTPTPMRAHTRLRADFASTDPDRLSGTAQLTELIIATDSMRVATDTVTLTAVSADSGNHISFRSEALTADLNGQYKLTELATALQNTIHRYYRLPGYRPASVSAQQWVLTATVLPSPLLQAIAPQINGTDTLQARVGFSSEASDLDLRATTRKLVFAGNTADSLNLQAQTADSGLGYALTIQGAQASAVRLYRSSLTGSIDSNNLGFDLRLQDAGDRDQYALGGNVSSTADSGYRLSLQPGSVLLNYDPWAVPADNYLQYDARGVVAQNFSLSNRDQLLSLNSQQPVPSAPMDVQFRNFSIATISRMAGQDSLLLGGVINGDATVRDVTVNPVFTSDINIRDFSFRKDTVGNILVKVDNQAANTLAASVKIQGYGNDVALDGNYYTNDQRLKMLLAINNINLARMKAFSAGQLQDAGGNLTGRADISGTVQQPVLNGELRFGDAYVVPTMLGERFRLSGQRIGIDPGGIHFDRFTLVDSSGNQAIVDGRILTRDFREYAFDMRIKADNFQAVNARRGKGDQTFYGRLNLSTDIDLSGDMNAPVARGTLRINKGTDFKVLLPDNDPEIEDRAGVVRFVNKSDTATAGILNVRDTVRAKATVRGFDISADIETDSAARFTLVIDERNGDALAIRGTAHLTGGIDPSGKTTLTGSYLMQQGSYLLTLNFLKRQFNIQPGSTITWRGEPTSALVDITAIYVANTASLDLIEHQLAGRSASEINKFKQKLPFEVLLKMQGELLKPVITFDIRLPEEDESQWREVATKLEQIRQDQSELNKQVFALLLLNRFVDENPLENSAAGSSAAEIYLRQSASRILTDQLNRLASNLITGVDLNFGITSGDDYSSGSLEQRTDLNVGVSKRLMSDRLRVNVGSNFELEGPRQNNQNASQIASDVSVDYQLTRDGRYTIRAYRKNQYQDIVIGQVIENGVTFVFAIDYDNFREFFAKPKKDRKQAPAKSSSSKP